jgi:hypothetical protein
MKKIITFLTISALFLGYSVQKTLAFKPTVEGVPHPIIHIGAGAQALLGPLMLGITTPINQSFKGLQALSSSSPRPSFFSAVSGVDSFFSVLQTGLFAQKVFVGFEFSEFGSSAVSSTLGGQRLNLKNTFAAKNLDTTNPARSGRDVCVDSNGTIVLCVYTYAWRTSDWGACNNFIQYRDIFCHSSSGRDVPDWYCEDAKPNNSQWCDSSTYDWRFDDWGACTNNTQYRNVWCWNTALNQGAPDNKCDQNSRPGTSQGASCGEESGGNYSWQTSDWGPCSNDTQYRDVWCRNNTTGQQTSDGNCDGGSRPSNAQGASCSGGGDPQYTYSWQTSDWGSCTGNSASCSGSYTVSGGGSCNGSYQTTAGTCQGGNYSYFVPTGQMADVGVAEQTCLPQGLGIYPCQSGYNCSNNTSCPLQERSASCSSLGQSRCGQGDSAGECSWGNQSPSCNGSYTEMIPTGLYPDVGQAIQICGSDVGLYPCQSGYNCAGNTSCPLRARTNSCSPLGESACNQRSGCSWNNPTQTFSCSAMSQNDCGSQGGCSWNTNTQTRSCGNLNQNGCQAQSGCSWSGGGGNTQTRSVSCRRNDGQSVPDVYCGGGKPGTTQSC